MNPCKHGIIVTDCFSCAACDKEKIEDLAGKIQFLLNSYTPSKVTFQYMFPDKDVWIVRPNDRCGECLQRLNEGKHFKGCPNKEKK